SSGIGGIAALAPSFIVADRWVTLAGDASGLNNTIKVLQKSDNIIGKAGALGLKAMKAETTGKLVNMEPGSMTGFTVANALTDPLVGKYGEAFNPLFKNIFKAV